MKLPFTKSAPFPASAFIPTPDRLKMGVEAQAKAAVPPVNPALNTVASDRVAALGRSSAPPLAMSTTPPTPAAGPSMMMPAAPAIRPPVSQSPLGGMPTTSLSSRGGPMSYSPRGVGTTNPNAYAVGKNNKNFAERTGQMPAPMMMPMMPDRQAAPAPMMLGGPMPTPSAPAPMSTPAMPGRDDAFWASMDNTAFMADQEKLSMTEQPAAPPELFAMEGAGGYVPMLRQADGSTKTAGGFFPGPAPDPMALPALPTSPEEQAQTIAKQAQQQAAMFQSQGMVPTLPKQATDAAGRTYAPARDNAPRPFTGKIQTEGGAEVMDKATGKMVKTPVRQFTVMEDPKTGKLIKRYVEDADGNGVPDNKEQSAPSWLDWLNSQAK
jgi:hypothetical protein